MNQVRRDPTGGSETLDSWKAIAVYLRRDVRTVMRWEHVRGMPVRRIPGGGKAGVYALRSELDGWWKRMSPHPVDEAEEAAPRHLAPSVAVLPFVNLSADKENEYFSDGLADEIITALTRVPRLRVTARTSSFAFRGQDQDVRKIGATLGVRALLEGSVQRSGQRLRVSAQLVDTNDGFHLWSERFDCELTDVFTIQDEISHAIAGALKVHLAPAPRRVPAVNLEAYNNWLRARHYQQCESLERLAKSRVCLERAIALDPHFAQPFADLAGLCRTLAHFSIVRPRDALAEGQAAIAKAFELDPSLGEAHALSGAYRAWMHFDWDGAGADFDRALELAPGSEQVHRLRAAHYLVPTSRLPEAEAEMELAVESDPLSPMACIEFGKVLLWRRQFERAQAMMDAAFDLRPGHPVALWYRGAAWYFQGRVEEAATFWLSALGTLGTNPAMLGSIGMCLAQLGRRAEARDILTQLEAAERTRYVTPMSRAQVYLGLGETDAAFEWLERAVEERDVHILILPCKPIWDGIRDDRRFKAILRKMRLA